MDGHALKDAHGLCRDTRAVRKNRCYCGQRSRHPAVTEAMTRDAVALAVTAFVAGCGMKIVSADVTVGGNRYRSRHAAICAIHSRTGAAERCEMHHQANENRKKEALDESHAFT